MTSSPPGRWLAILGIGEDGVEGLAPYARARLEAAELVVGGARHLLLAGNLIRGDRLSWPSPMSDAYPAILARRGRPVAVLASGDPAWYGVGAALARLVSAEEIDNRPAPSAVSLACARLGWALHETAAISFCGRPLSAVLPLLQPGMRLIALSADETTPAALAALLRARGFGPSRMHLMEALGGPRERLRVSLASEDVPDDVGALNLVALELATDPQARVIPLAAGLSDEWFEHDGQITKREVRSLTLSALAPCAGEVLWDVGCGSGSVSVEWMLRHPANRAVGIEQRPDRADWARRNAEAFGVPRLRVVDGAAPAALGGLPPPDAAFIGGGVSAPGVVAACWEALRPGGRLVANSVTLEGDAAILAAQARWGGELTRIGIERSDRIGSRHGFRPAMTVTQWRAVKG